MKPELALTLAVSAHQYRALRCCNGVAACNLTALLLLVFFFFLLVRFYHIIFGYCDKEKKLVWVTAFTGDPSHVQDPVSVRMWESSLLQCCVYRPWAASWTVFSGMLRMAPTHEQSGQRYTVEVICYHYLNFIVVCLMFYLFFYYNIFTPSKDGKAGGVYVTE